jgi:hypothetical protein
VVLCLRNCSKRLLSPHNRLCTKITEKQHPPISPLPSKSQCTRLAASESNSAISRQRLAVYNSYLHDCKAIDLTASPNLITVELHSSNSLSGRDDRSNNGRVAHWGKKCKSRNIYLGGHTNSERSLFEEYSHNGRPNWTRSWPETHVWREVQEAGKGVYYQV